MACVFLSTIFLLSISLFFFLKRKEKRVPLQSGLTNYRFLQNQQLVTRNKKTPTHSPQLATFFLLSLSLLVLNCNAQDTIHRKKVGLILSGGGAKGFAHIGVLKVLEQAGVKIDYIGGTSMGAVVGGLYASGYNATQIDSIFQQTNFNELLQDYIPRKSKSFYEKRNDELYAISLPFSKFSIGIPLSLSKGLYNYNLLTKLTHNVRHIRDFNKLPIPFLCIATNIETGKPVILNSGYLPQAILASSAFPTIFSPVEIDGKLLIDGGVTNNYPIDEIKKLGAEIIIGVDVQDGLKDRKSLKEATKILIQIGNLQMIEEMKNKIAKTDIYIKPNVEKYSVLSFEKGIEIIQQGVDATLPFIEQLKKLGTNSNFKVQKNNCLYDSIKINNIEINELKNYTRAYVIGKLGFKQGSKISYDDLKNGINTLDATRNFSSINYKINNFKTEDELDLNLVDTPIRTFLKFGLHYDGLYKSAILVNFTQKKSLFRNDVLSIDVGLGDNFRYNLDYYVDNGFYFSFGFKSRFNQFNRNVASDFSNGQLFSQFGINTLNIDFSDFTNQAYVQTIFAQKFLIGAGVEYKHLKIKSATLQNTTPLFEDSDYLSIFGNLKYDSFDNKYFPKKGWFFNGDLQSYLYSSNYSGDFNKFSIVKAEAGFAKSILKNATFKFQTEAGFSLGQKSISFLNFVLGGYGYNTINNFKQFYGYDFLAVAADSYIKSCATIDVEVYKKNHLNFSANYANVGDKLFSTTNWISTPKFSGYAFGYGLETAIGPIELKYSWSPELPKGFAWISVGFWF